MITNDQTADDLIAAIEEAIALLESGTLPPADAIEVFGLARASAILLCGRLGEISTVENQAARALFGHGLIVRIELTAVRWMPHVPPEALRAKLDAMRARTGRVPAAPH